MTTEIVWLGHDNTIDLLLKANGIAQDLSAVTKITATFGTVTITSTDKAAGVITWDQAGYDTGEIRMDLGGEAINARGYIIHIVVYDPSNTNGIVWGTVQAVVKVKFDAS
jgi:hypothetical protein